MSDYLDPNNAELLKDFFAEAQLQIDQLEHNILVLEHDPGNREAVDEIFRAAHTLKGASATVQMSEISSFTHLIEDVLDEIRGGKVGIDERLVDALLGSIDIIKEMIAERGAGGVYAGDIGPVQTALQVCLSGSRKPAERAAAAVKPKPAPDVPMPGGELSEYEILELREAAGKSGNLYGITVTFNEENPMNSVGGIQVFAALKAQGQVLRTDPEFEKLYEDIFHPIVRYYLASDVPVETLQSKLKLPDVVLETRIDRLTGAASPKLAPKEASVQSARGAAGPSGKAPQRGKASQPAPETAETTETGLEERQAATPEAKKAAPVREGDARKSQAAGGAILRVDSKRIDDLLNLVSETVITKAALNQIANHFTDSLGQLHSTGTLLTEKLKALMDCLPEYLESMQAGASSKDVKRKMNERFGDLSTLFDPFESGLKNSIGKFRGVSQNLARITGEFQEGVMRIRMVQISQIFSRFPRLVRDLSKSLNKRINLVIEGEDTELDKSVIEDLLDPLIHCVRNSIDHGIEDAQERTKTGKSAEGTILLKASSEGNMIIIEVADDGRGIDVDAVRGKAVERGLIHPSKNLSDIEAFNLIFEAGFSTAKAVTSISGRGVGLDVVRKQIEKLNGSVTVTSERGTGSRFIIKLPLTLAIIQGLLVRVGGEKYAIPITSVIDSHRIKPSEIKMIDGYEVFNVREDVVSLLRLNRLFKIQSDEQKEYCYVVVVGSGDKRMGLIVDSLIGEEDVVIKPIKDQFTASPGIAGANITGDGTVSLIIDVTQLLELGLRREREERRKRETTIS